LRYFGFSSKPIKNMKNISPISESTLRKGTASAGKTAAAKSGATKPNRDGPSIIPATISPMTWGCLIQRNPKPTILESAMTIRTSTRTRMAIGMVFLDWGFLLMLRATSAKGKIGDRAKCSSARSKIESRGDNTNKAIVSRSTQR